MMRPTRCPLCFARKSVPIVYGTPSDSELRDANASRVHLGGQRSTMEDPAWHCQKCGYEWPGAEDLA